MRKESAANPLVIRLLLLLASTMYALLLSTEKGKQWTAKQTWSTWAAGVALTLGFLYLEDETAARKGVNAFFWSGVPIIARSLVLQTTDLFQLEQRWRK